MLESTFDALEEVELRLEGLAATWAQGGGGRVREAALRAAGARLATMRRWVTAQQAVFERLGVEIGALRGFETDDEPYFDRLDEQVDRLPASIDAAADAMGMLLDLQLNERAYLVSVVATIFVPLTFVTGLLRHELRVDGRSHRQPDRLLAARDGRPDRDGGAGLARAACAGSSSATTRRRGAADARLAPPGVADHRLGRRGPDLGVDVACGPPGDLSAERARARSRAPPGRGRRLGDDERDAAPGSKAVGADRHEDRNHEQYDWHDEAIELVIAHVGHDRADHRERESRGRERGQDGRI